MYYKPRLTPDFRSQKEALLALRKPPYFEFPASVEKIFFFFNHSSFHKKRFLFEGKEIAPGRLWLESFRAIQPLLFKATGIFLGASMASAISTLVAMQILESSQKLTVLLGLSVLYFGMNSFSHWAVYQGGLFRVWTGVAIESYLTGLISQKILRLSSAAAARQSTGNLKVLITSDVKNIGQLIDQLVRFFIPSLTALLVAGPLLIHFGGRAGGLGLLVMVLILPISLLLNRISAYFQGKTQAEMDSFTSLVGEWVKNVRLIRYLSWDEGFEKEVSKRLKKLMGPTVSQHLMTCILYGLSVPWWMVSVTAVVVISRVFDHTLDLVHFFGSLWLLSFLAGYFLHLPSIIRHYGMASPSMVRIARFLGEEEQFESLIEDEGNDLDRESGSRLKKVIFKNVSFTYSDGNQAVRNFSFELDLTKKVAMVGEVGSGKTTFLRLLIGEYFPTQGQILVEFENGQILDFKTRSAWQCLRSQLAWVPQEPFVSNDLLSNNISLSASYDSEKVMDAAYWAELEADISLFSEGIQQEIGEGGVNLSGGQRQRLNLARAQYSGRPYWVMDDTLSAVDTHTETALMERLQKFQGGFFLVTHRTAELMRVEEVVVMRDGEIVERGSPADLASRPESHLSQVLRAYEKESSHV